MKLVARIASGLKWRMRMALRLLYKQKVIKIEDCGIGNKVVIDGKAGGKSLKIVMRGSRNFVHIGEDCRFYGDGNCIFMAGEGNRVEIGRRTTFDQRVLLVACEGTKIEIGEDCMMAAQVTIRTSDQHPIYDVDDNRINPAADINIGRHVWCGAKSVIMKGIQVGGGYNARLWRNRHEIAA